MVSVINKQLLLTAYAYLFTMAQLEAQQGSEALRGKSTKKHFKPLSVPLNAPSAGSAQVPQDGEEIKVGQGMEGTVASMFEGIGKVDADKKKQNETAFDEFLKTANFTEDLAERLGKGFPKESATALQLEEILQNHELNPQKEQLRSWFSNLEGHDRNQVLDVIARAKVAAIFREGKSEKQRTTEVGEFAARNYSEDLLTYFGEHVRTEVQAKWKSNGSQMQQMEADGANHTKIESKEPTKQQVGTAKPGTAAGCCFGCNQQ